MKVGLIGYPLGHSYSKMIHEMLADEPYELMPLNKDEFIAFMMKKDFDAINVTIPYKQDVLPYLSRIDDRAKRIGAVNTIIKENNQLIGYNTDAYGFEWMLKHNNIDVKNKKVAVLGNGGATKAVQVVLEDLGANQCLIVSRQVSDKTITYQDLYLNHNDVQIMINATPVGMYPHVEKSPVDLSKFTKLESVVDLIYNPLRTEFVVEACTLGCKAVGGLEMLVAQAIKAAELFRDYKVDDKKIVEITNKIINEKRNLVLIGMPGSGKSTLAKKMATKYQMKLIDIDEEIMRRANKSIKNIFDEEGEQKFRKYESEIVNELKFIEKTIISCGGGIVKSDRNINDLRKMGLLIWVDRDVEKLCISSSRPLSQNKSDVNKLYIERIHLYQNASDLRISNNETIETTLDAIENALEKLGEGI